MGKTVPIHPNQSRCLWRGYDCELSAEEDVSLCLSVSVCAYACGCELNIMVSTANVNSNSVWWYFFLSFYAENHAVVKYNLSYYLTYYGGSWLNRAKKKNSTQQIWSWMSFSVTASKNILIYFRNERLTYQINQWNNIHGDLEFSTCYE